MRYSRSAFDRPASHTTYAEYVRETDAAWRVMLAVNHPDGGVILKQEWFPKSQVQYDRDTGDMIIPAWLYNQKNCASISKMEFEKKLQEIENE